MSHRTSLFMRLGVAVLGTAGLWWFVMPGHLFDAIADGVVAVGVAGYVENLIVQFGL